MNPASASSRNDAKTYKRVRSFDPEGVVNPTMVTLAREAAGLTQKGLSEKLGITQGRLSKIEAGLLPMTEEVLASMATEVDRPETFFFQRGPSFGVGIGEIYHRKRADTPKKILARIYARIEIRIRQVAALLLAVEVPVCVRKLDIDEFHGDAAAIAQLTRATWGVPRGPIVDLTKTAEDAGIVIVPMDFETAHIDAIGRWLPGLPPMVFVNEHSPRDRYRFSVAHEIGHLLMHEFPTPDMEAQADSFAAEFLCPAAEIKVDLHDLRLDRLPQLKRYWRVSMASLIHRARETKAITANRARTLWTQMAQAGYTKREPVELDLSGEQPRLLFEMIDAHREELGFNLDELQILLRVNRPEFQTAFERAAHGPKLRLVRPA